MLNQQDVSPNVLVPYHDFSGCLNIRRSPYLLNRNQLQYSLNMWFTNAGVLSKRPGTSLFAGGVTGNGTSNALVAARFPATTGSSTMVSSVVAIGTSSAKNLLPVPSGLSGIRNSPSGSDLNSTTSLEYVVTALNAFGETPPSNEIIFPGFTPIVHTTVSLNWNAVMGATSYKIYRGLTTSPGSENFYQLVSAGVTSFLDIGNPNNFTTAGTPPLVNTAIIPVAKAAWARTTDTSWTPLSIAATFGTSGTTNVAATQMYDPDNPLTIGSDTLFLVDGANPPQMWTGPPAATTTQVQTGTYSARGATQVGCPTNRANTAPITPAFVTVCRNQLIYAGEPTEPGAVYISDPFFPEAFNNNSLLTTGVVAGTYIPYFVGRSDGVEGGPITGIGPLGNALMVYKQSAVYRMDYGFSLFGDASNWAVTPVSVSVGCQSPKSLVRFDTFHVFLGNNGVYMTDGISVQRISDNMSPLFEGPSALIQNRATAVACRFGQKYIIFLPNTFQLYGGIALSSGGLSPFSAATAGLPWPDFTGVWFDFAQVDENGLPTSGFLGMQAFVSNAYTDITPVSIVNLSGPTDSGQPVMGFGVDAVLAFGTGFSDIDPVSLIPLPIVTAAAGKLDVMEDIFGLEAWQQAKNVNDVTVLFSAPPTIAASSYSFTCSVLGESGFTTAMSGQVEVGFGTPTANMPMYATAKFGAFSSASASRVVGIMVAEASMNPWTLLGWDLHVNALKVSQ